MILSIDFRTDIPAFYSEWLINRFNEGYVYFRNPAYPQTIHKIILDKQHIEGIMWCSKDYLPILHDLKSITDKFPSIFHYTITGYGKDIEPNVPSLEQSIYIGPYTGLNYTWEQESFNSTTGELEDGVWTVRTNYFKVVPSSTVRVVFNRKCTRIRWIFKDVNGSIIAGSYYNTTAASGTYDISVNSSAEYMMIGLQKGGDSAPIASEQFFPISLREIDVHMFMYEGTLPSDMNIYAGKLDVLSGKLTSGGSVYYLTPQQISPFLGSNYFHNSTGKTTVEYYAHPVEPATPDSYYLDCTVTSTSRTFSWKPLP
jgi:hypothetical protein